VPSAYAPRAEEALVFLNYNLAGDKTDKAKALLLWHMKQHLE
jgi:hypothetical protein